MIESGHPPTGNPTSRSRLIVLAGPTAVGKGMAVVAKSNADNMLSHGSIFAPPADLPQGVSADSVFDR